MADDDKQGHLSRRTLLIGGGAGVGLLVAWAVWPRTSAPNLTAARGEHITGALLKIGADGRTVVAVPQAPHGRFEGRGRSATAAGAWPMTTNRGISAAARC